MIGDIPVRSYWFLLLGVFVLQAILRFYYWGYLCNKLW